MSLHYFLSILLLSLLLLLLKQTHCARAAGTNGFRTGGRALKTQGAKANIRSKHRDPNPKDNSLIRKKHLRIRDSMLCLQHRFLTQEFLLGLGSLRLLLTFFEIETLESRVRKQPWRPLRPHRWNRNPPPRPEKFSKLVFLI